MIEKTIGGRRRTKFSFLGLGIVVLLSGLARAEEGRFLTRSLYLPIEFRLCRHLTEAVFYQDGQAVSLFPVRRIFLFTYYPDLNRLAPAQVDIRVEGRYGETGEPFVARMAVSADGLHTAREHKSLGLERAVQGLRFKRDVHSDEVVLRIACDRFCGPSASQPSPHLENVAAALQPSVSEKQ